MAGEIVRPSALPPRSNPVATEVVPSDNGSVVGGVTWADGVAAGRPLAGQAEAEAGVNATKAMTPLTTKQAINAQAVLALVAGDNTTIDATDPQNPVVSYNGSGVTDGDKGDVVVSGSGATWQIARRFDTVALLLADTDMDYTSGAQVVSAGQIVEAQGFRYEVAASGASDGHVSTAGGAALYLRRNADLTVYSEQAGITAATTSAAAINKMLSDALAAGARTVKMAEGEWEPDGQIVWPAGLKELDWQGARLTQNSSVGSGEFALSYSDALEVLPALSSDIDATTEVITFASDHGLAVGDVIGFRNTTPSSLNTWRTYYYDGQPTIVREVVSATEITVFDAIDPRGVLKVFPSASTEVIRYPTMSSRLALRNLTIEGNTSPYGMVQLQGMTHFELENIISSGGSYAALSLSLGAYGRAEGLVNGNFGAAAGQQYGLVDSSISYLSTYGTVAYGTRHAIAHGSPDGVGSLPPRGNRHYDVNLGSSEYAALDAGHGNILDLMVKGGTSQGIVLGGSNNDIELETVTSPTDSPGSLNANYVISGANFHDTNHRIKVGRLVVSGDGMVSGAASAHGVLGFGGTANVLSADTVDGGTLSYEIGVVDARNWTTVGAPLTRFRNRGFAGQWGLRVHLGQIICPVEPSWFNMGTVSGSDPILLDIDPSPDRWDPSAVPTHGWNAANRGIVGAAVATGGQIKHPPLIGSVAHGGGALAPQTQIVISVPGFSGLTTRDSVDWATSANPGAVTVSPVVTSGGGLVLVVSNQAATGTPDLSVPALTWYTYVTKRP